MPLRKDGGMFILDVWISVPTSRTKTESCSSVDLGADESHENRKLLEFCTAEVSLHNEDFVSPCSDLVHGQVAGGGCKDIMSHEEDIFTLNGDGEAL